MNYLYLEKLCCEKNCTLLMIFNKIDFKGLQIVILEFFG